MSAEKNKEGVSPDHDGIADALADLRQQLRFQQALGITVYPLNEDVQRFLQCTERPAVKSDSSATGAALVRSESPSPPVVVASGPAVLATLRQEVEQCSLCRVGAGRQCTVQGQGASGSRLMVVGDWPSPELGAERKILFGPEEDAMLWKMMEAISLQPEEVYVTNIIKCCPGSGPVPDRECGESCFSYLVREIGAVGPLIICAMGDLAAMMLIESREPLIRLRGRFAMYRNQLSGPIPVMPTFHPRYLLNNPEMKRATWMDLQAIRRRLDQSGK